MFLLVFQPTQAQISMSPIMLKKKLAGAAAVIAISEYNKAYRNRLASTMREQNSCDQQRVEVAEIYSYELRKKPYEWSRLELEILQRVHYSGENCLMLYQRGYKSISNRGEGLKETC